jgi:hypothetical protein
MVLMHLLYVSHQPFPVINVTWNIYICILISKFVLQGESKRLTIHYSQNGSSLPPKAALMVLLFEYSIHYSFLQPFSVTRARSRQKTSLQTWTFPNSNSTRNRGPSENYLRDNDFILVKHGKFFFFFFFLLGCQSNAISMVTCLHVCAKS